MYLLTQQVTSRALVVTKYVDLHQAHHTPYEDVCAQQKPHRSVVSSVSLLFYIFAAKANP